MNAMTDAILSVTNDTRTRLAMLVGSYMESGWNPGSVGDQGTSFGGFQIHLPAHPGVTAQEAEDPTFAAKYMLGAYQNGVSQVSPSLWSSNPAQAAATAAYYAERPLNMYPASSYTAGYSAATKVLGGANLGPSGTDGGTGLGGSGNGTAQNASFLGLDPNSLLKPVQQILNQGYVFGLIAGGVVVMGLGFYWMLKGSAPSVSVPRIVVNVPQERRRERSVSRAPESGPREGTASRYATATRVGTPQTIVSRAVRPATRPRPAVPSGSKREIERVR